MHALRLYIDSYFICYFRADKLKRALSITAFDVAQRRRVSEQLRADAFWSDFSSFDYRTASRMRSSDEIHAMSESAAATTFDSRADVHLTVPHRENYHLRKIRSSSTIETIKEEDGQRDNMHEINVTPDPSTNESPEIIARNEDELEDTDHDKSSITELREIIAKIDDQQEGISHEKS